MAGAIFQLGHVHQKSVWIHAITHRIVRLTHILTLACTLNASHTLAYSHAHSHTHTSCNSVVQSYSTAHTPAPSHLICTNTHTYTRTHCVRERGCETPPFTSCISGCHTHTNNFCHTYSSVPLSCSHAHTSTHTHLISHFLSSHRDIHTLKHSGFFFTRGHEATPSHSLS